jgi:hypothetical protein
MARSLRNCAHAGLEPDINFEARRAGTTRIQTMHNNTTTTPPTGKNRFRPFRARLAHGQVQVRMRLAARATLPDHMTDLSWQLSLPHARLLHAAIGAALQEAEGAGLVSRDPEERK